MNELNNNCTNRFQRSIRIDTDFEDLSIVNSFVSSDTANKTIIEVCKHITNNQLAFTWTGAYGSGKSSLAVILNGSLSHKNSDIYKKSLSLVSKEAQKYISGTFENFSNRIVLPIVAGRENLQSLIFNKLLSINKSNKNYKNLFDLIDDISSKNQLIIMVDELGKYLEFANAQNEDIQFLQDIAEKANRSKGSLIFIGILHQTFSEYTKSSEKDTKQEWAKIQGRFIDIPINVTAEEHLNLMSYSLSYDVNNWDDNDPNNSISKFKDDLHKKYGWISKDNINSLYPLNPISAFLISAVSKRSFAQNQRTIFGFINSVEPFGFKTIYQKNKDIKNFYYSPSDLWDYLYTNLDTSIVNSSDSHNWITSLECVDRSKSLNNELAIRILKTISLIQLFGSRTNLSNQIGNIYASFPFEDCKKIDQTLNLLLKHQFILYREITKTFHISDASDFDLEITLKKYLETWEIPSTDDLQSLLQLRPIIGKKHYVQTGNFRYMTISLIALSELNNYIKEIETTADGEILICLPFEGEKRSNSLKDINQYVSLVNIPYAVALPRKSSEITMLIKKIWALQKLKEEEEVLKIDKVARQEVSVTIDLLNIEFENVISNILTDSDWTISRFNKKPRNKWSEENEITLDTLNPFISVLFDEFYCNAPVIKNELTNKNKVSGNANQAIKIILNRCLTNEKDKNLGIEKTPPELTIYRSIIEKFELHKQIKDNYTFAEPGKNPPQLQMMWKEAENYIKNSDKYVNASEIFDIWSKPPFGIKKGVFSVLLMMFMLTKRSNLAIFHENIFVTELDSTMVEWLLKSTNDFSFSIVDYEQVGEDLFNYHQILSKYIKAPINPFNDINNELNEKKGLPLEIGINLKKLLNNSPPWLKTTQLLTEKTLKLRDELKKANDPIDLCLFVLPDIFKKDMKLFDVSLNELVSFYTKNINSLKNQIISAFNYNESNLDLEELNMRAANIMKKTGDHSLDPFVFKINEFDGSQASVESVILTLLHKDPKLISDNDLSKFKIELSLAVDNFKKVEAHTKISKRKYKTSSMSFVYGGSDKKDTVIYDFQLTNKEKNQSKKIAQEMRKVIEAFDKEKDLYATPKNIIFGAMSECLEDYLSTKDENET